MLAPLLSCVLLIAAHGGQYQPPIDPDDPDQPPPFPTQPGEGPVQTFQAGSWEWWFDFNQEGIVRLRERMAARPTPEGERPYEPLTADDRLLRIFPVLADATTHRHRDIRATAALSLGRLALAEGVPLIQTLTRDQDLFVRTQATLALGMTGLPGGVEALGGLLADVDLSAEERFYAAVALGLSDQPEAHERLRLMLDVRRLPKQRNVLRWGLVYAAGVSADPALVPDLLAMRLMWLWRNEAALRSLTAVALGHIGGSESIAPLLELLAEQDNQVRRSAAAGLEIAGRHLDDVQVRGLVKHESGESDWHTRFNLLRALAAAGGPVARAHLEAAFADGTTLVRPHAALALGMLGDRRSTPLLLDVLDDMHEVSTRSAIVVALGLLGDPSALPPMRTLLEQATIPTLQGYLALGLGLIGEYDPDVVAPLAEQAHRSHEIEVTRLTILGLGLLGARRAIDELAEGLADDELLGTMDRAARLFALGQVGDRRQLDALLEAARDEDRPTYVMRYALGALGDLGDPRPVTPLSRLSRHVEMSQDVDVLFELYRAY